MADTLPATQQALKVHGPHDVRLEEACPLPQLKDDEILVRVRCVALNPADAKTLDMSPMIGATLGCDFAGGVVRIGPTVKMAAEGLLRLGDRVCGFVYGNHPSRRDNGAFAEFVAVPGDLVYRLPAGLSYQQAATIPVGLSTVGFALYHQWKLPLPYTNSPPTPSAPLRQPQYVLVYGGNTATGGLALQMLKHSGLIPICTCSPSSFARVKALGAAEAFDYNSPTCGVDIRKFTDNTLTYAFDCITNTATMRCCYEALGTTTSTSDAGATSRRYLGLEPFPVREHTRRDVKPEWILTFTILGAAMDLPRPFGRPARPRDRVFGEAWYRGTQRFIDNFDSCDGPRVEPHPVELGAGSLEGVVEGLDRLRKGDVKGAKLVYEIA